MSEQKADEQAAESTMMATSSPVNSAEKKVQSLNWMRGFIQILTQPEQLDALRGANVYKIYVSGSLLYALSFCLASWISFQSVTLRTQSLEVVNTFPKMAGAELQTLNNSFEFTRILGNTLLQNGLIGYAFVALMLWVLHRVFSNEPLRILAFVGMYSYTASISAIGFLINAGCQLLFSSINSGFSLASFVSFQEHPLISGFLTKFDLFCLWSYIAAGLAAAAFMGKKRIIGLIIGGLGFLFHAAFSGSIIYLSYQSLMQGQH